MKRLKPQPSAATTERIVTYALILLCSLVFWSVLAWLASRAL